MKTDEKIAYALKRISELELLINHWRKSQNVDKSKTTRSN
jgi:hypothetical protein